MASNMNSSPDPPEMSGALPDHNATRQPTSQHGGSLPSNDHVHLHEDATAPAQPEHRPTGQRRQSFFVVSDRRRDADGNVGDFKRIDIKPAQRSATIGIGKSKKRREKRTRLSSLDAILRFDGNVISDPEAQIPLPESRTSSLSSDANVTTQKGPATTKSDQSRSSLDILTQHGVFHTRPTPLPSTIPLPDSRAESFEDARDLKPGDLEPGDLKPGDLKPGVHHVGDGEQQSRQHTIPQEYHSYGRLPPLRIFNWERMVAFASEILPHLSDGRIHSPSRHEILDITCVDYGQSFRVPPVYYGGDARDESVVRALGNIPADVKQRVVVVEDLSPRTINCLGTRFGISPEFFEEHLINSGYENGNYNDPPSNTWSTSGMKKTYVSLKWHRPVFRLPVVPYSKQDVKDLLDPARGRVEYTSDISNDLNIFQTETNIFRSEWDLWTNPRTTTRVKRVCGWEERVSIWTHELPDRDCRIVVILLDPTPTLGEGIERDVLAARRLPESIYASDSELSATDRHATDAEALDKLAEHIQERYMSQQPVSRLQRIRDFIVNMGRPKVNQDTDSYISDAFEIVETTTFNKLRSREIFEQISPRAHVKINFEDAFQSPRLMERLRFYLQNTRSTKEDYLERLLTAENNSDHSEYYGVLGPLFQIVRQDVLSLIKLLHKTLDGINVDILDEDKMEESLSLWRELITRAQLELPELRRSMINFFSFFHVLNLGVEPTTVESQDNLDDDIPSGFKDISKQIDEMLRRLSTASSSLTSNMALLDSRRSIAEAQAVTKLTELAFFFIPLTFAASLFGMQIEQFENRAPLSTFVAIGIGFTALSYMVRLMIRSSWLHGLTQAYRASIKVYADTKQQPVQRGSVPASLFLRWLGYEIRCAIAAFIIEVRDWFTKSLPRIFSVFWHYSEFIINTVLMVSIIAVGPLAVIWTRSMDHGIQVVITLVVLVSVIALIAIPYWRHADPDVRSAIPRLLKKRFKHFYFEKSTVVVVLFLCMALAVPIVPLAVIWTRPVAPGIKAAITVVIVLVVLVTLITWGIYRLVSVARMPFSETSSSSGSRGSLND